MVLARTLTSSPLQNEGKEPRWPLQPHTAEGGGAGRGQVGRLVLVPCCTESQTGNWLFLRSAQALLLSFRGTVLEAQQGRKYMLQIESKSIVAKVVADTAG